MPRFSNAGGFDGTEVPPGLYNVVFAGIKDEWYEREDRSQFAVANLEVVSVGTGGDEGVIGETIPFFIEHPLTAWPQFDKVGGLVGHQYPGSYQLALWLSRWGLSRKGLPQDDGAILKTLDVALSNVGKDSPRLVRVGERGYPSWYQGPTDVSSVLVVFAGFQHRDGAGLPTWSTQENTYKRSGNDDKKRYQYLAEPMFRIVYPTEWAGALLNIRFVTYLVRADYLAEHGEWEVKAGGERAKFPAICENIGAPLPDLIAEYSREVDLACDAASQWAEEHGQRQIIPNLLPFIEEKALGLAEATPAHLLLMGINTEKESPFADWGKTRVAGPSDIKSRMGITEVTVPPLVPVNESRAGAVSNSPPEWTAARLASEINRVAGEKIYTPDGSFTPKGVAYAKKYMAPLYSRGDGTEGYWPSLNTSTSLDVPPEVAPLLVAVLSGETYRVACDTGAVEGDYTPLTEDIKTVVDEITTPLIAGQVNAVAKRVEGF